METVSPNFFVNDIEKSIKFYNLLGFKTVATVPEQGEIIWAMMNCGNINFMFQTFKSLGNDLPLVQRQNGGSLILYIQIKGIRNYFNQIKDNVTIIKGLEKTFYGATEFSIKDINNFILTFAEDE